MEINLSVKNRITSYHLKPGTKKIEIEVSRKDCKDILLELVDKDGNAKSKPLNKFLPEIRNNGDISVLRFIMNDFNTKPIAIKLFFK